MDNTGKILIADDERTFLKSMADLLRKEGYQCDCASDSDAATQLIQKNRYDLLIADIKMPGNEKLEFIHQLPVIAKGLPVIILTAFPSIDSAVQSIHLPVIAYLVKPIDFDELKVHVKSTMDRSHVYRVMKHNRTRLINWQDELTAMIEGIESEEVGRSETPLDAFLTMTFQNINRSLTEIRELTETLDDITSEDYICRILKCPRAEGLGEGLREAVKVLERTKSAFKSKALADLREKLSTLLEKIDR
jgi:DNA-binding response OmpR family regulator